jgi:hypothetical protein
MTVVEMHVTLMLRLQQVGAFMRDDFLPEELDVYLNTAQRQIVKQLSAAYKASNNPETFKLISTKLAGLIVTLPVAPVEEKEHIDPRGNLVRGEYVVPYPLSAIDFIDVEAEINRDDYEEEETSVVKCIETTPNKVAFFRRNPLNDPYIKNPRYIIEGDELRLFCDRHTTATNVSMTYVVNPEPIDFNNNITSSLPEFLHDEVIDLAYKMILSDLYTRQPAQEQKQEANDE